jgi:hypothetical protein
MYVMLEARIIAVNTHGLAAQPSRPARGKDEAFVAELFEDSGHRLQVFHLRHS